MKTPTDHDSHETSQVLNGLYDQLGLIEEKEIFLIESGLYNQLESVRSEMRPIKLKINEIEGWEIYDV